MGRVARRVFCCLWTIAFTALLTPSSAWAAQTTQYTYDALGRVISAIDANGKKVAYTYDAAGNRTRVSNGAEFTEIVPTAWSASSNAGTTGLATSGAMRDGDFNSLASIHATNTEANAWIMADLGSAQTVNHIDIAPAIASAVGASPDSLNGTVVEYSVDGSHWAAAATINAVAPSATRTVAIGGVSLRYLRIRRTLSGQVAIGDLRLYSAAVANSPLIANPDSVTSTGSAVTFDPRANDQDLDGYAISISAVEDPPHGTAVVNSGASVTYTPDTGYFGADSFLYTVTDGHNGTASARVNVLVRSSVNHPPVAANDNLMVSDRVTALVDGTNNLRPVDNDYDADGDVLTITAKTDPAHGTVTIVGSNVIQYQPTVGFDGADSFTYTISDGRGPTSTATINLTVANANPIAGADNIDVSRGGSATFDARLNDRDPDGDPISITAVSAPANGTATLNPDQTITYAANPGAVGVDTFTYTLSDGRGGSATGSVNVAISANGAPVAIGDNISAGSAPVTFDPRANDSDPDGDPLTVVKITAPAHGTAAIASAGASVTYTAAGGYTGSDSFTYTISDPQGLVSTATIAVNSLNVEYFIVAGGGGGANGGGGGGGGGVLLGTTTINLSSPTSATVGAGGIGGGAGGGSGGASTFGSISAAGGGGGGSYIPPSAGGAGGGGGWGAATAGAAGTSGQGYRGGDGSASDLGPGGGGGAGGPGLAGTPGLAGSGGRGIDSAFSGVMTNYAAGGGGASSDTRGPGAGGGPSAASGIPYPAAAPANQGGGGGGIGTSTGGSGGSGIVIVRYLGKPKATGGTITQVGGYTIHTFTANGSFSLTAANHLPVAVDDTITAVAGAQRVFDPRANDSDPDGDVLTLASVGPASHGTVVINKVGGGSVIYMPAAGYTGADSFTYTISDGAASATATVNVTVSSGPTLEYLLVGGGGGGGGKDGYLSGGGGGGGVLTGRLGLPSGSYSVVVGSGGAGSFSDYAPAANGGDSSFAGLTAGGGGAGGVAGSAGAAGGSGGGASVGQGGAAIAGQGRNGGSGIASGGGASGGGGGASAVGQGGISGRSGAGGEGLASTLSGTSVVYGSGGGGGGLLSVTAAAAGGTNGGSGSTNSTGLDGSANTGGGGGGGGYFRDSNDVGHRGNGGSGGSGIVIFRYLTGSITGATGGTVTTSGGYTIRTFTTNGTFVMP